MIASFVYEKVYIDSLQGPKNLNNDSLHKNVCAFFMQFVYFLARRQARYTVKAF